MTTCEMDHPDGAPCGQPAVRQGICRDCIQDMLIAGWTMLEIEAEYDPIDEGENEG